MKSQQLEIFINKYYLSESREMQSRKYEALYSLFVFLEKYPRSKRSIIFTKRQLHSIFNAYFQGFDEIEDFIGELSYKYPYLLKPIYYFEDDDGEREDLEASDVFKYISKRSNISPISGEPLDSINEFIFVEYAFNHEAVENG